MSIKTYRPTTPARRQMTVSGFDGVDKHAKPERSLIEVRKKNSGRNSYGRITVRHKGGGNRRKYRVIDFKRDKMDAAAQRPPPGVRPEPLRFHRARASIEDGERRYILAPVGLAAGDSVVSSSADADIKPGNCLPLENIPVGTVIHNIELYPGQRRSARPRRRRRRSADGQGRRHGHRPYAQRRDAQGAPRLQGHHRPGRQHRPRQRQHRQGRPQAPHGHPSDGPRLRHEPLRPPPRRRRGQGA